MLFVPSSLRESVGANHGVAAEGIQPEAEFVFVARRRAAAALFLAPPVPQALFLESLPASLGQLLAANEHELPDEDADPEDQQPEQANRQQFPLGHVLPPTALVIQRFPS